MTIHIPGLGGETLRLSDSQHSEILSKDHTSFTLAEGESEFTVEQIATSAHRTKMGWVLYLILQILTALPRAIGWRKPIFVRCNPILLTAKVKVNSFRFSDLTLFLTAGGYSREVHSYQPPTLTGDKELSIQMGSYAVDSTAVEHAIREETMSKIGYCVAMLSVPALLIVFSFLTNYGIFFAASLGNLPFMVVLCILAMVHSRRVRGNLREKVADTLRNLNNEL